MSRALATAIASQDATGLLLVTERSDAAGMRKRFAVGFARPIGMRVLAWCDRHPTAVGSHRDLVEDLRHAISRGERIAGIITRIYSEIPEAMEVES